MIPRDKSSLFDFLYVSRLIYGVIAALKTVAIDGVYHVDREQQIERDESKNLFVYDRLIFGIGFAVGEKNSWKFISRI